MGFSKVAKMAQGIYLHLSKNTKEFRGNLVLML